METGRVCEGGGGKRRRCWQEGGIRCVGEYPARDGGEGDP